MADCIFCKIANGEIPSEFLYEDDYVVVIKDINPMAKVHLLVLTKEHICCANMFDENNSVYAAKAFEAVAKVTKDTVGELKKVTWTPKAELIKNFKLVIATVVAVGLAIAVVDVVSSLIINSIAGLIG